MCQDLTVECPGIFVMCLRHYEADRIIFFISDKIGDVYIMEGPHWPYLLTLLMNIVGKLL